MFNNVPGFFNVKAWSKMGVYFCMLFLSPAGPIQKVAGLGHLLCTLASTLPKSCPISCRYRDATARAKTGFHQLKDRAHSKCYHHRWKKMPKNGKITKLDIKNKVLEPQIELSAPCSRLYIGVKTSVALVRALAVEPKCPTAPCMQVASALQRYALKNYYVFCVRTWSSSRRGSSFLVDGTFRFGGQFLRGLQHRCINTLTSFTRRTFS